MTDTMHPNLAVMNRLDIKNLDACKELFTDDFVWHYYNPKWPDFGRDYQGISGLSDFFAKMKEFSNDTFQVTPVDARPVGDELVVVHARNRFMADTSDGGLIEFDAVVIWRIVEGKITEAWDIPAVHTMQVVHPGQS